MNNELYKARIIARIAHAQQTDKAGDPYINHVQRVAESVREFGPKHETAAWLHDVVEDTGACIEDLGIFSQEVLDAVVYLTNDGAQADTYAGYIDYMVFDNGGEISIARAIALRVKEADLYDHLYTNGAKVQLPDSLVNRYQKAYDKVLAAVPAPEVHPA